MEKTVFKCKYGRCLSPGEIRGEVKGKSPCLVDPKGFIGLRQQIEKVLSNGVRLEAYRRKMYDPTRYDNATDESEPSPVLDPDFLPSVDFPTVERELASKIEARGSAESPTSAPADVNKEAGATPEDSATNPAPTAKEGEKV